ncbi:MAG: glycosyltransferase family 4 protein [Anaerolineae bacterium]
MTARRPLRVVMVGPFGLAPKATMQVRAMPLARALAAQGHAVKVVMPPWHTPAEAGKRWRDGAVEIAYVPLGPRLPLLGYLCTTLRLVSAALAWHPDVVHCFKPKAYAGLAAWVLWHLGRLGLTRVRLVVDEDDWEGPGGWNDLDPYPMVLRAFFAWQERWGLRHAHAVTAASRTLESLIWALGVPPARVFYLPNGAPTWPAGNGAALRQRLGWGAEPVLLLYTRFFEFDPARAVEVYRRVRAEAPTARLLVVGRALHTEDDARFDRLAAETGLADRITRAGWVPFEELPHYLAASDAAIYPFDDTLVNRTKCSVKLTDLLSAGIPVVADAVGQNAEYIVHGESGLLVADGDAAAMASAVGQLFQDEALRRRLGVAATRRMREAFGWDGLAGRALQAYGVARPGS